MNTLPVIEQIGLFGAKLLAPEKQSCPSTEVVGRLLCD